MKTYNSRLFLAFAAAKHAKLSVKYFMLACSSQYHSQMRADEFMNDSNDHHMQACECVWDLVQVQRFNGQGRPAIK